MIRYVFSKMLNKKWMILSLLIGNILLISIAMSNIMYTSAVTQRLLTRKLADSQPETGVYPGLITMDSSVSASKTGESTSGAYLAMREDVIALPRRLNTPALYEIEFSMIDNYSATPVAPRGDEPATMKLAPASLTALTEHARIIAGRAHSAEPDENGVYDVLVSRTTFIRKTFVLGEELRFDYIYDKTGAPLTVRIAGVFDSDDSDYWVNPESYYAYQLFFEESAFSELFVNHSAQPYTLDTVWYTLIDYEQMRSSDVPDMRAALAEYDAKYNLVYLRHFSAAFTGILSEYLTEANQSSATLKVLQAPVFALLLAFIFMVSRQILEIEKSEISVLKSRGASSKQVVAVYFTQSAMISIASLIISLPVSAFLCRAIGSANAFLDFVSRSALSAEFTAESILYGLGAALVSVSAMALPAIGFARRTIVDAKRDSYSRVQSTWWQKFYLDFAVLAVSLYGLYSYGNQKTLLAERVALGASLDPLLYISSSLFAVGASLVMVRVIPFIAKIVFSIAKNKIKPAMYASFLQIQRSRRNQAFMMTFLMLTIAIGILNADTARTVNLAQEEQLRYDLGADVALKEAWYKSHGEYVESDMGRYLSIPGVESACAVVNEENASVSAGATTLTSVKLMGIDTRAFGQTAYMKDGLSPEHFFTKLNSMSQTLNYVLLSQNFADVLGFKIGDSFSIKYGDNTYITCVAAGFVEYFPTYNPKAYVENEDGTVRVSDRYMVVANINYLRSSWGLTPYEIWLKSPGDCDAVYDFANSSGARYWKFADIYTKLAALRNSPSIQGTNGILTLSFIIGLVLCAAGFLIFWVLSIKSRTLQFGIYRAMGMSNGELTLMLLNEQLWQSVMSILCGAGIGYAVSVLFIPLIQIAYSSVDSTLPLVVTRDIADHFKLLVIIFAVMCACLCVLITIIRRLKTAQALKLGED